MAKARWCGYRVQARVLHQRMASLPSADPNSPGYRRLRYIRYADDHLDTGLTARPTQARTPGMTNPLCPGSSPMLVCMPSAHTYS